MYEFTAPIYTETLIFDYFLPSILRLKLPQSNVFKQEDYEAQRFPNNTVKVYSMLTFLFPSLSDNLY